MLNLNLTLLLVEPIVGYTSICWQVKNVSNLEELAETMCYNIGAFPTTYLGLPLGAKLRPAEIRNGVTERFERRLATWKMQYLSMGDGLTVINNVFDGLITYFMSLFPFQARF